jgi:hypothetical protein
MASIANIEFWLTDVHKRTISQLLAYFNMKVSVCSKHDGNMIIF